MTSTSPETSETTTLGFAQIVIDCARPAELAGFWSELLGRPVAEGASDFWAVVPASADRSFPALMFLAVPEPRTAKNRLHVDLVADDPDAAVSRAVVLGATRIADFDEWGAVWTTCTDPEGNVFDIGGPHQAG